MTERLGKEIEPAHRLVATYAEIVGEARRSIERAKSTCEASHRSRRYRVSGSEEFRGGGQALSIEVANDSVAPA